MSCYICGSYDHEATTGGCPKKPNPSYIGSKDIQLAESRLAALWVADKDKIKQLESDLSACRQECDGLRKDLLAAEAALSKSCDEQRGEYYPCKRAESAEAKLTSLQAALEEFRKFESEIPHMYRYSFNKALNKALNQEPQECTCYESGPGHQPGCPMRKP